MKLQEQRLRRPAYRVYDTVSDDVIKIPDGPTGTGPRSGQAARQRIIADYFT